VYCTGVFVGQSGEIEVFLERTPGYPDGVTNGSNETYWISLVTLNSRLIQSWMSSRSVRPPPLPSVYAFEDAAALHDVNGADHQCKCGLEALTMVDIYDFFPGSINVLPTLTIVRCLYVQVSAMAGS
jgi:hypothetical protein